MESPPEPPHPKIITILTSPGFQLVFSLLAICLTIFYNAAYYFYVPLTGVWLDYQDQNQNSAIISSLDPGEPGDKAGLQVGDVILTIDGRQITNLNIPIHQPKKPGEIEIYVIQRNQRTLTIPLVVGSYLEHLNELASIVPIQLLSILICLLGLILLFFTPPASIRGHLIALTWALAGVAIAAAGPGYTSCTWLAPQVAMLTFAASIFISTAAHLYFPVPSFSNRTRNSILGMLFSLSIILAVAYLCQQIYLAVLNQNPPNSATASAITYTFYFSVLISIGLLLKNRFFVKDEEIKRQISIIFGGSLLGILPFLLFSEIPKWIFGRGSEFILLPSNLSILPLILVPISYGYVIYQRQLLKVDFIINRALVLLILVLITLFASFTLLSLVSIFFHLPTQMAMAGSLLCVLIALPSASLQKRIRVQVDKVLYGGYYDYATVTSELSTRLAQTVDRPTFVNLLTNDLPQKMKVQKSALLLLADDRQALRSQDDLAFSIPLRDEICTRLSCIREPLLAQVVWEWASLATSSCWQTYAWAQVFLALVHGDTLYGLLILGDRATGDIYSNQDLQILATIGQQAALSIANIMLVETLRGLAQQLVRSDEEQRKKIARDLHDSILQNLFFVKQRLARSDPEAASFVDDTITTLRQTIKTQRSSLLDRGLILALQDLINQMEQLAADDLVILWHNHLQEEIVLSDEKATSIYRIVQESLANVLKHAQADQAIVTVKKETGIFEIQIEDNGIGIASNGSSQIGHHYGLLGMRERATMIGAEMSITSEPGSGTTVTLKMKL